MAKDEYNWWTDPKNQEEVKRISWWDHEENRVMVNIPISAAYDGTYWSACTNRETEKFLGESLGGAASGRTKDEAIEELFLIIRLNHEFYKKENLSYQRWVPFRKGPWSSKGGKWLAIFGIHIWFRYGKNMKRGWHIPFTKLNVSMHSDWAVYSQYKKKATLRQTS